MCVRGVLERARAAISSVENGCAWGAGELAVRAHSQ